MGEVASRSNSSNGGGGGTSGGGGNTTYATECIIPGEPEEHCAAEPFELVGAECWCRASTGVILDGMAQ
jgi:hypothetical protein